jgi:hypothetical protein
MITVERINLDNENEIERYTNIYTQVFNHLDIYGNAPTYVYYAWEEDKLVGMVAGYSMATDLFYIQRAGYITDEQHRTKNLARTREVIRNIHLDWPFILTLVRNDDANMLRMCIALGFKIIGTRIDTEKNLWVEMMYGGT